MTSYPAPAPMHGDSGAGLKLLSVFLGLVVVIMGSFGLWLAISAQHAAGPAAPATPPPPPPPPPAPPPPPRRFDARHGDDRGGRSRDRIVRRRGTRERGRA